MFVIFYTKSHTFNNIAAEFASFLFQIEIAQKNKILISKLNENKIVVANTTILRYAMYDFEVFISYI